MHRKLFAVLLASTGLVLAGNPAGAQPVYQSGLHEQVTVVPPYVMRRQTIKPAIAKQAAPAERISVDRRVSYSDLDLTNAQDARRFEGRIRFAASAACTELNRRFSPLAYVPDPPDQNCVGMATQDGLIQARMIIRSSGQ